MPIVKITQKLKKIMKWTTEFKINYIIKNAKVKFFKIIKEN